MKKYMLFTLLLSGFAVQQTMPQTKNPLSTEYSGFETLVQTLPINDAMRVTLAVFWDQLPDVTQAQQDRKAQLAKVYKARFGDLDLADFKLITPYKEYFDKTEAMKVRYRADAMRLNQTLKTLQTSLKELQASEADTSGKLQGLQNAIGVLSSTLNNLGTLLSERDTYLTSGESISSEDVVDVTKKIADAQRKYKEALNELRKQGNKLNLSIKLDNSYLNIVTKAALAESGVEEQQVKAFEEEEQGINVPEEETEETGPSAGEMNP